MEWPCFESVHDTRCASLHTEEPVRRPPHRFHIMVGVQNRHTLVREMAQTLSDVLAMKRLETAERLVE